MVFWMVIFKEISLLLGCCQEAHAEHVSNLADLLAQPEGCTKVHTSSREISQNLRGYGNKCHDVSSHVSFSLTAWTKPLSGIARCWRNNACGLA